MKKIKVAIFSLCAMFMGMYFVGNSIKVSAADALIKIGEIEFESMAMGYIRPIGLGNGNSKTVYWSEYNNYNIPISKNEWIAIDFENLFNDGYKINSIYSLSVCVDTLGVEYDEYDGSFSFNDAVDSSFDERYEIAIATVTTESAIKGITIDLMKNNDPGTTISKTFKFQYTELDVTGPVFNEDTNVHFVSNYDSPISMDYIKSCLTVTDETDGDCTDTIEIVSTNYTLVNGKIGLGEYYVEVRANDSSGNSTTAKFYVDVVDVTPPNVTATTFTADNRTLTSTDDIIAASLKVTDNCSTNFKYEVASDNYTSNYAVAGNYEILVKVSDESGNSTYVTIQIINEDWIAPTWKTTKTEYECTNAEKLSQETLLSFFAASDESCTPRVFLNDDHGEYFIGDTWKKANTYTFEIIAEDEAGNQISCNFTLKVKDVIVPTIKTTKNEYTVNYITELTLDQIKENCTVTDESTESLSIQVVSNNYVFDTLGTYTIVLKTNDGSNDSEHLTITINVIDNIAPTISGATNLYASNKEDGALTEQQIKNNFVIEDKSEYSVTLTDNNKYFNNQTKVGNYSFTLTVTDVHGNVTTLDSIIVTVQDEIAPIISISDMKYVIIIGKNDTLTREQVLALLEQLNIVSSTSEIAALNCAYFDSLEKGDYDCEIELVSGEKHFITLRNIGLDTPEPTEPEEVGFWAKVGKFFKDIWNAVCSFASNVWNYGIYNTASFVANIGQVFDFKSEVSFDDRCKNAYFAWANKKTLEVETTETETTITSTVLKMEM